MPLPYSIEFARVTGQPDDLFTENTSLSHGIDELKTLDSLLHSIQTLLKSRNPEDYEKALQQMQLIQTTTEAYLARANDFIPNVVWRFTEILKANEYDIIATKYAALLLRPMIDVRTYVIYHNALLKDRALHNPKKLDAAFARLHTGVARVLNHMQRALQMDSITDPHNAISLFTQLIRSELIAPKHFDLAREKIIERLFDTLINSIRFFPSEIPDNIKHIESALGFATIAIVRLHEELLELYKGRLEKMPIPLLNQKAEEYINAIKVLCDLIPISKNLDPEDKTRVLTLAEKSSVAVDSTIQDLQKKHPQHANTAYES